MRHADYYCAPVPAFGARRPRLLVVGLAPGLHGANATGRPFTGDHAGILLYRTLYDFGFASAPESRSRRDGLRLIDCRVTNAVKCLPPGNKPRPEEVARCNAYLAAELSALPRDTMILALGRVAHAAVLRAVGAKAAAHLFAHARRHALPDGRWLFDSYHCSRYNTQTGRLRPAMFRSVFRAIARQLADGVRS